ncbi:hypothetical protein ACOMHN_045419 [Nucella lapillus]
MTAFRTGGKGGVARGRLRRDPRANYPYCILQHTHSSLSGQAWLTIWSMESTGLVHQLHPTKKPVHVAHHLHSPPTATRAMKSIKTTTTKRRKVLKLSDH